MADWLRWFDQNWFNLIQTAGIIGSFWLTVITLRRDARGRKLTDYLTLAAQHRELWSETHRRAELARVVQDEVDLVALPITTAEQEFLLLAIVHFQTGWLLAKDKGLITLDVLATDARSFFSLPLPRAVWEETRSSRDPQFVTFIEQAMTTKPQKRPRRRRKWLS